MAEHVVCTPERIQRKRAKGWRMPEGAVYVGRPTKWGNPHRWTDYRKIAVDWEGEPFVVSDSARRRFAVVDFQADVEFEIGGPLAGYPGKEEIRRDLAGRDLACWCPLDESCHADVLLKIANSKVQQ